MKTKSKMGSGRVDNAYTSNPNRETVLIDREHKRQFKREMKRNKANSNFEMESNHQFDNAMLENQYENRDSGIESRKWDIAKLIKLKDKLVEATYLSDSFFTYINSGYDVLDFYELFKKRNDHSASELIKELITNSKSPIVIDSTKEKNMLESIKRLFSLMQTSRAEFGVSALKVGWPFIAGGFEQTIIEELSEYETRNLNLNNWNEEKYVNSQDLDPQMQNNDVNNLQSNKKYKNFFGPLLLWPVSLYTRDRKVYNMEFQRKFGQVVVEINSHILLSVVHNNNLFESGQVNTNYINVDSFVKVLYDDNLDKFMDNIFEKYESLGVLFNQTARSELKRILENFEIEKMFVIEKTEEKTVEAMSGLLGGPNSLDVKVLPFASIGVYPIANVALYIDYIKMLQTDGVDFINKIDNIFYNQLELAEEYHKYFSETSLKEIVKLDFSQKKACNVALSENLVISGAAGNGKSQTISSIVANSINNSKSVLFSTEKKEAANVIFNRLGRLRNYSLRLFESDNFAKDITTQLKNGLERVSLVYGIKNQLNYENSSIISERLDNIYAKVNNFKSTMMTVEGQNYPDYIYKKMEMKEVLKEVIRLVGPVLKHSEISSDFWFKINKTYDDYNEFQQLLKVKENLEINDDLFLIAFDVVKFYDGNDQFFENILIQYVEKKAIDEKIEVLPENEVSKYVESRDSVDLNEYKNDKKALYWALRVLFENLDDFSVDILKSHNARWYTMTSGLVKQKSTELILEFREKFSPDEFDFQFFRDYYAMEKFAADHGDSFQVDNENYYESIDNLISNKLGEDIKATEFMFALKVTQKLKENPRLAKEFNKLYALMKNTEVVNAIDDLLINYSHIISLIFPLVLGSPSMIAKYIVCKNEIFDVCIIDEASMIPLENALSLLYRSSQWIVSGDIKQLPPSSYQKNIDKYNRYQMMQNKSSLTGNELDEAMKYRVFETPISLLEYIGTKVQTVVLEYHYRSIKKELFEFSNVVFYKKRIHVADDQKEKDNELNLGINLVRTNGYCENGINKKEAEEVVKLVEKIVNKPNHGTIGIITTTNEQRDYIENLLLEHPSKLVTNEFARISENGEDDSIFVLTCEKVQGSERDNIIISLVASHDVKNKNNILAINNTLGLLATEVGPNFLNVLITRSRQALFIFNSFDVEDIVSENNQSLIILKDYLEYARLLTTNGHDLNDPRVQAIFKPYIKNNAVIDFSNDMKGRTISRIAPELKEDLQQVFAFEPRIEIVDGWFEGDIKIDIVIKDKKTNRNIMAVLCDEFIYDVMLNGKQRDYYNRKFLETRNWHFFSISSLQWSKIYKRQAFIGKIINMLSLLLNNWNNALRICKLTKYQVDENGNTIIVDNVIKNAKNRLEIVEIDSPIYYPGDELLDSSISKKDIKESKKNNDSFFHEKNIDSSSEKKPKSKIINNESKSKAASNLVPVGKKHEIVTQKEYEDYNYNRRRKEWHQKAGHNEKQEICSICKDNDNWASILLENNKHICYYCWIKKPDTLKNKKTTTKKASAKSKKVAGKKKR